MVKVITSLNNASQCFIGQSYQKTIHWQDILLKNCVLFALLPLVPLDILKLQIRVFHGLKDLKTQPKFDTC